jgi:RNA exonuclease 1
MLQKYILTEDQLDQYSFPKWMDRTKNDTNNRKNSQRLAFIPNYNQTKNSANIVLTGSANQVNTTNKDNTTTTTTNDINNVNTLIKSCKRCDKNFHLILRDLSYAAEKNSECIYHWGKLRKIRFNNSIEDKYSCCNRQANSDGCMIGKHVYDGDYDGNGLGINLTDYVETTKRCNATEATMIQNNDPIVLKRSKTNMYALDCEMCYTTKGLELTRVSVIDINFNLVYESLVKPATEILDYNTRWSGLTQNSLTSCNKTLKQVQNDLLKLFNKDTILIGHSLESDFKALKLVHRRVIDTTAVFPHKIGLPLKRSLKNLMLEYLQKNIQEDGNYCVCP